MSPGDEPLAWREARERLEAAGFRPSRRLGQNFLLDDNMARALARDAGVGEGDQVVEIGPGLGFLTGPLLETGARVLAVEIDARLHALVGETLGGHPRLELLLGDALASKHRLNEELEARLAGVEAWHLVANLPYSVSAPLLVVASELPRPPATISVLVQLEVAERICAAPGTSDWGPLSARLQAAYEVRLGRTVGCGMFWPRPKVESAVAHLALRPGAASEEGREARVHLSNLVQGLFQRRRQALGRVLGELVGDREAARAALTALGVDPSARAETLDLEVLRGLAASPIWRQVSRNPRS